MKMPIKYIKLYLFDKKARENVFILFGMIFTGFYVIFNLIAGIFYQSAWFVAVGVYHSLMLILRYSVIDVNSDTDTGEESRFAGRLMLVVSLSMGAMIGYTVISQRTVSYSPVVLIILATYTAYTLIRSVYAVFIKKGYKSHNRRIFNKIRLTSGLLSLFNLQISILSCVGVSLTLARALNFLTGAVATLSSLSCTKRALTGNRVRGGVLK